MRLIGILASALVAILSLIVAVVLPPIFGNVARSALDDLDRGVRVGQAFGTYAELNVLFDDWDAGWYSSTASMWLNAEFGGAGLFSAEVPVPVILRHGPMISGTPSGLGVGSIELVLDESSIPALRQFDELAGVEAFARLGLLLGFGGGARVGLDVPDFRFGSRGDTFRFGGLEAVADLASDAIDLEGEFDGLQVREDDNRADVGRVSLMANVYKDSRMPALWLGDVQFDSAGFTALGNGQHAEAGQFHLRLGTGISGDVFDARVESELSHVRIAGENGYGEGAVVSLEDLAADVGVEYGADAVAALMDAVSSFGVPEDMGDAMAMLGVAEALLRERVLVRVSRLSFAHENRPASASLMFEFRGDELPRSFTDISRLLRNPDRLPFSPADLPITANFDLAFHQDLPHALLLLAGAPLQGNGDERVLEEGIRELARGGLFEDHGDEYAVRVEWDDGMLRLNGERIERVARQLASRGSEEAQEIGEGLYELAQVLGAVR